MTPAERKTALVEKVARAMCSDLGGPRECNPACPYCMQDATAALTVALEGAAKARAPKPKRLKPVGTGALLEEQQYNYDKGYEDGVRAVRSAIRALIPEGDA